MNVEPLGDRVAVRAIEGEEKTHGGIFIPEVAKEKPMQGEVIAIGTSHTTEKMSLLKAIPSSISNSPSMPLTAKGDPSHNQLRIA